MKSFLVAALVAFTAMAGCADSTGDETPNATKNGEPIAMEYAVPVWSVGDYWTYTTPFGEWSMVVTDDSGSSYTVDTNNKDLAFSHVAQSQISYLGNVGKTNLEGSQEAGAVKFFDFPLSGGKTWKATWDGQSFEMIAHDQENGKFHIIATSGATVNQYLYNNATKWVDYMSFGDNNGTEFFRMTLTDSGTGFLGELYRVTPTLVHAYEGTNAMNQGFTLITMPSSTAPSDAYLIHQASCEAGQYSFAMGTLQALPHISQVPFPTEDQGFSNMNIQCPDAIQVQAMIGESPSNGDQWGWLIQSTSQDLELSFELWLREFEVILMS